FLGRVAWSLAIALMVIAVSLVGGVAGDMGFAHQSAVDAFLNAAMVLGGVGAVGALEGDGGKGVAGGEAAYFWVLVVAVAGVVLAPVFHRVLHAIHADEN